jgi:hypothetical protein
MHTPGLASNDMVSDGVTVILCEAQDMQPSLSIFYGGNPIIIERFVPVMIVVVWILPEVYHRAFHSGREANSFISMCHEIIR